MKQKLAQWMSGRYGLDQLYRVQVIAALVLVILSSLTKKSHTLSQLCGIAAWALLLWAILRVTSRNIEKRYKENLKFLELTGGFRRRFRMRSEKFNQRKDYKFFVCPTCKTNLRVPKGKGEIYITCSKCGNRFKGKT